MVAVATAGYALMTILSPFGSDVLSPLSLKMKPNNEGKFKARRQGSLKEGSMRDRDSTVKTGISSFLNQTNSRSIHTVIQFHAIRTPASLYLNGDIHVCIRVFPHTRLSLLGNTTHRTGGRRERRKTDSAFAKVFHHLLQNDVGKFKRLLSDIPRIRPFVQFVALVRRC